MLSKSDIAPALRVTHPSPAPRHRRGEAAAPLRAHVAAAAAAPRRSGCSSRATSPAVPLSMPGAAAARGAQPSGRPFPPGSALRALPPTEGRAQAEGRFQARGPRDPPSAAWGRGGARWREDGARGWRVATGGGGAGNTWRASCRGGETSAPGAKEDSPPPKSGEVGGPKAIENTLAPTWEAQPVPPVPELLRSHGERLRAEDPDWLQEKARFSAGPSPLPPSSLPTRNRWGRGEAEQVAESSDQGPQVNDSGREIVDFYFQAFGLQNTHLLAFACFLPSAGNDCRKNGSCK